MKAKKRQLGGFQWFVLRIRTGREDMVERCLGHRGFATFCPFRRRWHWANAIAKAKRKRHARMVPLYAGYCFIGLSEYTPTWAAIWPITPIICVLGSRGVPMIVDRKPLEKLIDRHGAGEFNAPVEHRYHDAVDPFKVGDKVLINDGLIEAKVEEIEGRKTKLIVNIFGADRLVEADVESLVAA